MSQITIRDLPDSLEAYIRKRAKKEKRSLSKVVNEMLEDASGLRDDAKRFRDLSAFSGSWSAVEAAEFQKTQEAFERIDEDAWK